VKDIVSEEIHRELEKAFIKFSEFLLELSTERKTPLKGKEYEALLKTIVDNVSFIHSGSVLLKDEDGVFYYVAACNHNFDLLKNVKYTKEEIALRSYKNVYIMKRGSIDLIKELSQKLGVPAESLKESKSIENIKAFVSIPIKVQRKIVGFFNLDTWDSEETFEEKGFLPFAEMIGTLLSLSVERFELIKSLKDHMEQVNRVMLIDPITFLPNYRALGNYFERYVSMAKRNLGRLFFLIISLDNFSELDRKEGVEFGNNVLKKLSKAVEKVLRKSDILCSIERGRFVILSISNEVPEALIQRVYDTMDRFLNNMELHVSSTIGLAEYGKDGKDIESLINASSSNIQKREYQQKIKEPLKELSKI
jgi:diguanylate cyclase (GGDEF)-like protein